MLSVQLIYLQVSRNSDIACFLFGTQSRTLPNSSSQLTSSLPTVLSCQPKSTNSPCLIKISGLVNNTGKPKTLNMPMDCNSIMGWPDQGDMARPARLHPMCGLLNHASLDMGRGKVHFIHVVYFCLTLGITLFPPSKRRVLSSIQDKMRTTNIGRELVIQKQLSKKQLHKNYMEIIQKKNSTVQISLSTCNVATTTTTAIFFFQDVRVTYIELQYIQKVQ